MKSIKMPTSTKMRLLVMASAALLVITTAVAIFHTQSAQAQVTDKNVTNLTLHSANPGQMAVTWDQPALPPDDYRINWARADETFPPYDAANGNIYTESTSHTINDLDVGAVYKVRVKARYDGQSNGPWSTTATLRYATPTLIAPQDETSRVGDAVHLTLPAAVNGTSPYSYTVGNLPQGLAFDPASRTITGTPINAETTPTAYKVTDVNRQAASATFSWTVTVLNQTPTVSAAASADTAQPNDAVTLTATAADADGEQLQYLWTAQPDIGVLSDISQATTNWTAPQTDTAQAIAFTVRVSDPSGNHASARIYVVNIPNNEPVSTTPTAQPYANGLRKHRRPRWRNRRPSSHAAAHRRADSHPGARRRVGARPTYGEHRPARLRRRTNAGTSLPRRRHQDPRTGTPLDPRVMGLRQADGSPCGHPLRLPGQLRRLDITMGGPRLLRPNGRRAPHTMRDVLAEPTRVLHERPLHQR